MAILGLIYATLGGASLLVPEPDRVRVVRTDPRAVLVVGIGAVAAASWLSGPAVPVAWGATSIALGSLAAVAEEALFRRLLYGQLARFGAAVAVVGSALAFALIHLPAYGWVAMPIDLAAGLLLSWQRYASGTWAVPAATHVLANAAAMLR